MEDTYVRIPVTVSKRPGRKSGYVAEYGTYPRSIECDGATAADAKASLVAAIVTAIGSYDQRPAFARDDDGALWAAVPASDGGSSWYRVTGDGARLTAMSSSPTADAFTSCVGFEIIPGRI